MPEPRATIRVRTLAKVFLNAERKILATTKKVYLMPTELKILYSMKMTIHSRTHKM
jgi:hypothetical protein